MLWGTLAADLGLVIFRNEMAVSFSFVRRWALASAFAFAFTVAGCGESVTPGGGGRIEDGGGSAVDGRVPDGDAGDAGAPRDGAPTDATDGSAPDGGVDPFDPNNARKDSDCDGLSDQEEFATIYANGQRTAPDDPDTDDDGISDGVEVGRTAPVPGTDCPVVFDADPSTRTSPVNPDSDGDGVADGDEDRNRDGARTPDEMDPTRPDTDGDGLADGVEDANRNGRRDSGELDPRSPDSDGDGLADGIEDRNRDGIFDDGETNPLVADTDGDGLLDGEEDGNANGIREAFETDPTRIDTDCDGLSDGDELLRFMTSPLRADSDGDGLADGLERGVTEPIPGSGCDATVPVDVEPGTTTDPDAADSDGDGLLDGDEDTNRNGRVDPGESDPNDPDSDGDGLDDGDEVLAGFDPTDAQDPEAAQIPGILAICADTNLKAVDFNDGGGGAWTLVTEPSFAYAAVTTTNSSVAVAAFDDAAEDISGFIARLPLLGGAAATASAQAMALDARVDAGLTGEGLTWSARVSGRNITSHDGFETVVSAFYDVDVSTGSRTPEEVREAMVRLVTNLQPADLGAFPTPTGAATSDYVYAQQVLLRTQPDEIIVVGALLDRTIFQDRTDNAAILINDLINGSALAEFQAPRGKNCDPFRAEGQSVADFIWMADISGSTDDDRSRITNAANLIVNELTQNNVDFRMGVVPHSENDFKFPGQGGDLRRGFTSNPTRFAQDLQNTSGTDGCEFGLEAVSNAIDKALPRSPSGVVDPNKLRDGAALAVVYISDEFAEEITDDDRRCFGYEPACDTGIEDLYTTNDNSICEVAPDSTQQACIDQIVQPYVDQIVRNNGVAFAQVIVPNAAPTSCVGYGCGGSGRNEPGRGYVEVVNATGGSFYSPCNANPGNALQSIIDAVAGAASQYQLTGSPISSTLRVGIIRLGQGGSGNTEVIPRDRDDGFDYDAASNSIFFRGFTYRPNPDDIVVISYRRWEPPASACGPCAADQECDEGLGVCVCKSAICSLCADSQVCDANCDCACTLDCNGTCGVDEVCNPATCACECPADCGGRCGPGTVCNPSTCACECADCGGACAGTLNQCELSSCACECPADCGGACTGNTTCNESLCECVCEPDCAEDCSGREVCDPAQDCACACPADCGGCPSGSTCDEAACACTCPDDCAASCVNNEVCSPETGCGCVCPEDCGGCDAAETCDPVACACVPVV